MATEIRLQLDLYRQHGTWVFDDEEHDIVAEPFVCGMSEMIDQMIEDFVDEPCETARNTFAATSFPGSQERIVWLSAEDGGDWYRNERTGEKGWLCPVLYADNTEAPAELHVAVEVLT